MKKTIAILLVLVIGMAGVFAASADLTLITTVPVNDEIKLTPYENSTYNFGSVGSTTDFDMDFSLDAWDNTSNETAQSVAYVHARSNRSGGFKVTATATALSMSEAAATSGDSEINYYIGYKISAGDAIGVVIPASDATTSVGTVMTVAAPIGQGYSQLAKAITVIPAGKSIDYKSVFAQC